MRDPKLYLNDIVRSCDLIVAFIDDMNLDEFLHDEKTKSAVVWQFQIIGEAPRQLPDQVRNEHSEIPWKEIIGMRNVLTHGYFGVDYQAVWDAFITEVPTLRKKIEETLRKLE